MKSNSKRIAAAIGLLFALGTISEANAFTRNGTVTGPRGKQATYGGKTNCVKGQGCTSNSGATGPNGKTISRSATFGR